jgi:sulfofructose kinase
MSQRSPMLIGGAGICCLDHIFTSERIAWGETARVEDCQTRCGGLVGTALAACQRLGGQTRLASMLGKDGPVTQILTELQRIGINTDDVVQIQSGRSPLSFIHLDSRDGERTIFHYAARGLEWKETIPAWLADCAALLIDDYYSDLSLRFAQAARKLSIPVIADTWPKEQNGELLRSVNVLISPRHFAHDSGFGSDYAAALRAMREAGPQTAVLTLGGAGWLAADADGSYAGKGFAVKAVDTVGAGDVFHGAFAFAVGMQWPTARCAEFASAVAALKCANNLGWEGIPQFEEALKYLRANSQNDWNLV